jgi:hypothetical protein
MDYRYQATIENNHLSGPEPKMRKLSLHFILIFATSCTASVYAQEKLHMQGTEITGNKELPKVLYIVPWKSVERFEISSPPIASIMEQKLTPIDRASFKRTINYHDAIFTTAKTGSDK